MGLDVMELVMEMEETFRIVLPDSDLGSVRTLGDLYGLILRQMDRQRNGPCLSSFTFYRVRRAFVEASDVPRWSISPRSRLEDLLPIGSRRFLWERLQESLGSIPLPNLTRPGWLIGSIAVGALAFLGIMAGATNGMAGVALWGGIIAAAVWARLLFETAMVTRLALRLSAPLAVCIPRDYVTVRDLVQDLMADHYGVIASEANPDGPEGSTGDDCDVWEALCRILSKNLGIDRNNLSEATTLMSLGI
jgi:hypothetical protein